jgi:hypothetical protein
LYANVSGVPGTVGELYGYYYGGYYNYRAWNTTILTNTADEVMVKHITSDKDWVVLEDELNTVTYRIVKDGGWIEVKRADPYYSWKYTGAVHSGPNRKAVMISNDGVGNDVIIDAVYDWDGRTRDELPVFEFNYVTETNNDFLLQDIYNTCGFHTMFMYSNSVPTPYGGIVTTFESTKPPRLHALVGQIAKGYDEDNALYVGVINQEDVFWSKNDFGSQDRQVGGEWIYTGITVDVDDTYASSFTPTIPGHWRMSGKIDDTYYTQDVTDGDFTFVCPAAGQLETLTIYLYDRNESTPSYVNTPMDIYRDINGQTTPTPPLTPLVQELIITGITAVSRENYGLDTLDTGKLQYIDRSYTFSSVPSSYADLQYIRTANDDKASTGITFIEFDVNHDVTVYVAHDDRISPKPSWLASFTDTGDDLVGGGGTFSLYANNFSAGHISLGGNTGDGSSTLRSMYNVILEPLNDNR